MRTIPERDDDLAERAFAHGAVATAVFDLAATGTFGRIVEVNAAFARCFGRAEHELRGTRGEALCQDYGTWQAAVRRAATDGTATELGVTVRRRDAPPVLADLLFSAIPASSHVVVQLVDRTPHEHGLRSLRESETRLREIVENVQALVWAKDLDGRYLLMNRRCQTVFGIAPGMVDAEWAPANAARDYVAHDREVLGVGTAMEFLEEVFEADVARTYLSLKFPLHDDQGRAYAVAGIATDITAVKQAEIAASEARDLAEKASRAKSEFLSRMSHELRTPLNSILGYAQLLTIEGARISPADASGRIVRAGKHLLSMIDDVLAISRIEEGADHVNLRAIPATDPLLEAVEIVRPIADAEGIMIELDLHHAVLTYLQADPRRLKQVLINLLVNAVRYNGPGQPIHVCFERAGDRLTYCVSDRGAGLSKADAERVFAPFDRLDRSGTHEGVGLGLTVSQALTTSMGGHLAFRERPGGGTSFLVEMPVADAPDDAADRLFGGSGPPPPATAPTTSGNVLYIEDNPDNVDVVRRALGSLGGVRLAVAANAADGLRAATEDQFDVVLLDLHLPDAPGREIIGQLRSMSDQDRLPIIVLSADATRDQIDATMAAGADAYLTKPLDMSELLSTVSAALPS